MDSKDALRMLDELKSPPDAGTELVAAWIRDVTTALPVHHWGYDDTRDCFRCIDGKCPMGLLPTATDRAPFGLKGFEDDPQLPEGVSEFELKAFARWWDHLPNTPEALNAALAYIWPA